MTVRAELANQNPDAAAFQVDAKSSPIRLLTNLFIREGIDGLGQIGRSLESSEGGNVTVIERWSFEDIPDDMQEAAQLELGGIVLGLRLQHQEQVFADASFPYRQFVEGITNSIKKAGGKVGFQDPYPDLTTIDLGASYEKELDANNKRSIKNPLHPELRENFDRGKRIKEVILGDRSLVTLATDISLLPDQVQQFMQQNGLMVCDYQAQPVFQRYAETIIPQPNS